MSKNKDYNPNELPLPEGLVAPLNIADLQGSLLENFLRQAVGDSVVTTFSHLLPEKDRAKILSEDKEKKNQDKTSGKIDKLGLRAERDDEKVQDEQEDGAAEEDSGKEADTSSPKVKAQKLPSAMEPEDIAKMLNIIRAGKSLKDPDVKKRFDVWWDALTPPEKIALKGFLDGIAQIIAGDIEAEDASKPSADPYNVQMGAAPKEKPRRPTKNNKQGVDVAAGTDAPIVVGEVNSAHEIKKRMIT